MVASPAKIIYEKITKREDAPRRATMICGMVVNAAAVVVSSSAGGARAPNAEVTALQYYLVLRVET